MENAKNQQRNAINTTRYWIYLIIAWSIHNLEEALTMSKWLGLNEANIPMKFIPISTIQESFPIGLIIVSLLLFLIPIIAIYKKWDNRILAVALGIFLINAIQHILISIVFMGYSPGVITALLINLPLSVFMIKQLFKHKLLENFSWLHIFVYGAIGFIISISAIWVLTISIYYTLL